MEWHGGSREVIFFQKSQEMKRENLLPGATNKVGMCVSMASNQYNYIFTLLTVIITASSLFMTL